MVQVDSEFNSLLDSGKKSIESRAMCILRATAGRVCVNLVDQKKGNLLGPEICGQLCALVVNQVFEELRQAR